MKKLIAILLTLILMLGLAACTTTPDTPDQPQSKDPVQDSYSFTYNGKKVALHAPMSEVIAALGKEKSYSESASCAFEGLDKTYGYGSFYIQTYPVGDKDYVFGVWFADDSVTTDEGVYVGMTQADVEAAYGAESFNGTNAYVMTKGKSTLTVILTDGAVSSIQYDAVVE